MQYIFLHRDKAFCILIMLLLLCISGYGCGSRGEVAAGTVIIEGDAVKGKVFFTLAELKSMDDGLVEADYFSLNSYGTGQYFHFHGIGIGYLLQEKVGFKDFASKVVFTADDGYTVEYALADVLREDYIDEQNPKAKYR